MVGKINVMKSIRWNESLNAAEDIMHNLQLSALDINVGHIQDYHVMYWAHQDNLTNCTGNHNAERMEIIYRSFALYWELVLEKFELNDSQKKFVKSNLASTYSWHLSYHSLVPQKKYMQARYFYWQAIKLDPKNIKYWKSFFKMTMLCLLNIKNVK
jgi:hypothetical protein